MEDEGPGMLRNRPFLSLPNYVESAEARMPDSRELQKGSTPWTLVWV
jgi:hypothetical protein